MSLFAADQIAANFDHAAAQYDHDASMQVQIARQLVSWSNPQAPQHILDIGCGTGFVAEAAAQKWPDADITGLDTAPAMLHEAQRKLPKLKTVVGDAAQVLLKPDYDAAFSSMMLHWLPRPLEALGRWQTMLRPHGRLYVALLVAGSFQEWRDLCRAHGVTSGLWPLPDDDFANQIVLRSERKDFSASYPSARDFLKRLKSIGAATPIPGHKPVKPGIMRQVLNDSPKPFVAGYQVLFLELVAAKS